MMNRNLTKEQLDYISKLCCEVGKNGYDLQGIDIETTFDGNMVTAFLIVTDYPKYQHKWIKFNGTKQGTLGNQD